MPAWRAKVGNCDPLFDLDGPNIARCSTFPAELGPGDRSGYEGFPGHASDLSVKAVERARREAKERGQDIGLSVCDMRESRAHHGGGFDVVISCDNSVPHLLSDSDILVALKAMHACLRPGGGCLLTVRDCDREPRAGTFSSRTVQKKRMASAIWAFRFGTSKGISTTSRFSSSRKTYHPREARRTRCAHDITLLAPTNCLR
jgi:SAM-dependent methyltransferase